jgi:hypothetical protein
VGRTCLTPPITITTRPLTLPAFRSANARLTSSSRAVPIAGRILPSAASPIASGRSSRPPTIEPRGVIRFRTTAGRQADRAPAPYRADRLGVRAVVDVGAAGHHRRKIPTSPGIPPG